MGRQRKRKGDPVHGWLAVDKPRGVTSTRVVSILKRLYHAQKTGHGGTLDPLADGILPIAFGEATKTAQWAMDCDKEYVFTIEWGISTSSQDKEGEVIATSDVRPLRADIEAAIPAFIGDIQQVPPKYSAIKIAGERAYDLARDGEEFEIPSREVSVYEAELTDVPDADHAVIKVVSGKGFYVRAMARDLATVLGAEGHVSQLRRTRVGAMDEAASITLPALEALADDMLGAIRDIGAENIAAFIAEPIMGAGGVLVAPEGYHQRMRQITADHDIKYIADEVVTAFGRLGHMFASEDVYGMVPDIITTAKGLTSGYQPLSATIISDEIYDVISEPGGKFLHGMTYSGHPAAAAAGLANIDILEREKIPERVRVTGKVFERALRGLEDMDIVGEVRGSHFMMGIEFVANKETKATFDDDINVGPLVAQAAQQRGLIARPLGNILILSPTLIMDEAMIGEIEGILRESIDAVTATLRP
ncbi:MAG: tRNA pseudouridine(55) synthase TruB [Henriciella sp.]|nr:tRNA pseudouridine(55) synthase TruB [Henriciella sp.]